MNVRRIGCALIAVLAVAVFVVSWTQVYGEPHRWMLMLPQQLEAKSQEARPSPLTLLRHRQRLLAVDWPSTEEKKAEEEKAEEKKAEGESGSTTSAQELFNYLHLTNSTACLFAVDFGFSVWKNRNVATPDGQKSVCLDQFIAPVYNNCLAYSFGINNEWTFDEAMAKFGCHVYSFDPSMGVDDHNRTELIHFFNLGLAGEDGFHPTKGWKMKTADSIYEMLAGRHGNATLIDVFKMDVEHSEWEVLPQMLRSRFLADKVKQLAVEIHFTVNEPLPMFRERVRIIQDLESTNGPGAGGFVRFSSRPNPATLAPKFAILAKPEYLALELSWYNSRFYHYDDKNNAHQSPPFFPHFQPIRNDVVDTENDQYKSD